MHRADAYLFGNVYKLVLFTRRIKDYVLPSRQIGNCTVRCIQAVFERIALRHEGEQGLVWISVAVTGRIWIYLQQLALMIVPFQLEFQQPRGSDSRVWSSIYVAS